MSELTPDTFMSSRSKDTADPASTSPATTPSSEVRRVTGSADIPLNREGRQEVKNLVATLSKPFNWVFCGSDQRFVETAKKFSDWPIMIEELNGWARGEDEGEPAHEVGSTVSDLIRHADKKPIGVSPISGEEGQPYTDFKQGLLSQVRAIEESMGPNDRVLIITSGGGLQLIDSYKKAGSPESFNFSHQEMAEHPYWSETGNLFRSTAKGLKNVADDTEPGLYGAEHGATNFNPLKTSDNKQEHAYSSTQVNLPKEFSEALAKAAVKIPDKDLADKGREDEPHITLFYGLHTNESTEVEKILKREGPITAKVGRMSIFPASKQHPDYDVVKMAVESEDLKRLNAKIRKLPNGNEFPEYRPHLTVAYVKKGEGKKYAGRSVPGLTGKSISFNTVTFSPKSGDPSTIALASKRSKSSSA